jgi:Baseplate J-like protein
MSLKPAIDYTNKDFASLRRAMLELARYRLPEWTDQSASDLGVLLVDLFAYMGDIILYYQDRIASESFLHTATERRSVLHLLRLIGYELKPPIAASADLRLTFNAPGAGEPTRVVISRAAQFATKAQGGAPQTFEYLLPDLEIDLANARQVQTSADGKKVYNGLPVRNSRTLSLEIIGSSTGEPNQSFHLSQKPLILDSLELEINEGAGFVPWNRRESLLYHTTNEGRVALSTRESREYYVQFDENDVAWVVFGDGLYGLIPPPGTNNIRARYRVGGGAVGNVPAGAISEAKTSVRLLKSVTNPLPAAGGADRESLEHAIRFGPLAFRSGQRAVTLSDFVSLAHQAGGVAKVRARSSGWNQIDLFIAPEGETCGPAPADLKKRLVAFFEDKRMVGTFIHIQDPTCVPIEINLTVVIEHNYSPETVRHEVEASVRELLAFKNVDFGRPLYLSKVYEAVEALSGVYAVTISRYRRQGARNEIEPDGRIYIGEFEIPTLSRLTVTVQEELR